MRLLSIILLNLLLPILLFATSSNFRFRHFSVEDGVSSNSVRAILQDKFGFLWFGTDDGLNRYDGTAVKLYKLNIPGSNEYVSVLFDAGEKIWIGTDCGLYLFDYRTEVFTPFLVATSQQVSITSTVNNITEDKDSNLWFSTVGQGIFRYSQKNNILEQYEFKSANGLMANVMVDNENQIWTITNWGSPSVAKLNKAENKFEPFNLQYETTGQNSSSLAILEDSSHTLWLGTWDCGLQKLDKYTGKVTTYLHPTGCKGTKHIHSLMEYAPNQLLIGSDDGLLLFNTTTGEQQLFTENESDPNALSNRFVYPIVRDREGGVWIGTYYGGVNYIPANTGQFESFAHSRYSNSVSGTVISGFCEDARGNIWIASDDGGLNCYSTKDKQFTHYMPNESRNCLSYHNVHALCMDNDNLWIGTYTGGVNVLNTKTGVFKVYTTYQNDSSTLDGSSSYSIFKDRKERIWVASMSGINLYNRQEDNFIRVKTLGALTIDIDEDREGNLWFSTQGRGLFKYDPEIQIWKNYTDTGKAGDLKNNQVNCTHVDSTGDIWVGTMAGLYKYNVNKDIFEQISLDIPSRNICSIIEDQGVLWLTTTRGLVRYTSKEGSQVFTKSDGLQSEQFLPNSALKASDGKIYIGSVSGFNAFYPYQIKMNKVIPPVVITGLEVFNKEIRIGDEILPKALNQMEQLDLSYKDNVVSLLYASLSYCTPEKNRYAYMLVGFDKDWNYVGSQNKATYTNLPPGTYIFKVKATNNDGVWNEEEANLKIVIHPPFYWNTFSKILYFILLCITLTFFIRFLLKRSEKKHTAEITQLNVNKEKEVHEAKNKFFTMIAHEIRTPVSLIIGPLEKIMKSSIQMPEALHNDLSIIDRNSQRLLFLVNQLLDFRKVEQEGMVMKYASQNICQLLEAVCVRFKPFITQHGVHLEVEYPNVDFTAMVDSEAVTKLISNLLTNASKYTKDKVVLSCTVQPEQHMFIIRVTDNGIGISKEEQQQIFKPFYQTMDNKPGTGIGLSIVKSIVELHNGCIEVESEVGKGSSFIVMLPIEQSVATVQEREARVINSMLPEDILQESLMVNTTRNKPMMLIVDDNEEMLNFLSSSFSNQYSILTAEDGVEALEKLKENDVTLIVSDWMMPHMDGIKFCKTLRSDQAISHIPFILLTAKTDLTSKIEGMDCGADAYIEKPFSVQYLEVCIKNLLDLRNLLHQKFSRMPMVPLNSIASNTVDSKFLTRINEIIEQNFSNPELSVDFLAEEMCVSRSGLFAKIKILANITPNELILIVRLKKAAALLSENKYRINEICFMVGFNNPSYFAKCFQKQFGIKPGEFVNGKMSYTDLG